MTRIILVRHGNTFGPGDKVVWAGQKQDLLLVEKGIEQAHRGGSYLCGQKVKPAQIYCGPLQRTRLAAEIIAQELGYSSPVIVEESLNELDYGLWGGLSNDEVKEQFGEAELEKWTKHSQWPASGKWPRSEKEVINETLAFLNQVVTKHRDETVILVSSNGRLRYFLKAINGEFERLCDANSLTVKTGNISELSFNGKDFSLVYWNKTPE